MMENKINDQKTAQLIERFKKYQADYKKNQEDILVATTRMNDILVKVNENTTEALDKFSILPQDVQQAINDIKGLTDLTATKDNIEDIINIWNQIYAYLQDYCDKTLADVDY